MVTALPAVEIVSGEQHKVLHLRGPLGLANGRALRDAALKMAVSPTGADATGRIHVDVSELETTDVAIVQVLAALHAESARRGRMLDVTGLRNVAQEEWQAAGWAGFQVDAN